MWVGAPHVASTGRGCAPARTTTGSEGCWLDPSSCADPTSLPWHWSPAHHITSPAAFAAVKRRVRAAPAETPSGPAAVAGDAGAAELGGCSPDWGLQPGLGAPAHGCPPAGPAASTASAAGRRLRPRSPAWVGSGQGAAPRRPPGPLSSLALRGAGLSCHVNAPRVQKNLCLRFGTPFRRSLPSAQLCSNLAPPDQAQGSVLPLKIPFFFPFLQNTRHCL